MGLLCNPLIEGVLVQAVLPMPASLHAACACCCEKHDKATCWPRWPRQATKPVHVHGPAISYNPTTENL